MFENLPKRVKVVEVGPRDGLQNESKTVATPDKVRLIEALAQTGLRNIEITSFVSPKWIPQLADGLEVARTLKLPPGVRVSALVPNLKGYESAKQTGVDPIAVFMSATETHSLKNINKGISEALAVVEQVVSASKTDGKSVRAYLSVVFSCPYEGKVDPKSVESLCQKLMAMGVDELSLGDTIGAATPKEVAELVRILKEKIELNKMALHFHDTRGTALVNVMAGLAAGVTTFDASVAGMGGCPYAPGAAGNLATEDLVYLLDSLGIETGIDLSRLVECGRLAEEILGKQLPGRYLRSALSKRNPKSEQLSESKEPGAIESVNDALRGISK
ncbi:MAG: hydroxymethylglutaryl-CoA lyase [Candidatus Melainabacteria bacterium]|nr:MAG: hydroxymethylglutaryl-CoA lyase [Candidatus Melainabacteria bacterium]